MIQICGFDGPFRLRTSDGGYVFLLWHPYMGPVFYADRICEREIERWYESDSIADALSWFIRRGEKA